MGGENKGVDVEKRTDERHCARFADPKDFPRLRNKQKNQSKTQIICAGFLKSRQSLALANTYACLNFMHPFRTETGVPQKLMLSQLAQDAGMRLDYMKSIRASGRSIGSSNAADKHKDGKDRAKGRFEALAGNV